MSQRMFYAVTCPFNGYRAQQSGSCNVFESNFTIKKLILKLLLTSTHYATAVKRYMVIFITLFVNINYDINQHHIFLAN